MVQSKEYIELLKQLISITSFSKEEKGTGDVLEAFISSHGCPVFRKGNNIYSHFEIDNSKPTVLLNSHHDTVKPAQGYTKDPFSPDVIEGKLYGLGSNDAGGALVCLLAIYVHLAKDELPFNIVFAASAEEEISGKNGIELLLTHLPPIDFAIVGEPTLMNVAVAEKGLMVLDCYSYGESGHAAREEGENAIYKALIDIEWFRNYEFELISSHLGAVKMSVTQVNSGSQHNVVPDVCHFVVDVRVTDAYTLEEVLKIVKSHVRCEVKPRSLRLNSSGVDDKHPIISCAQKLGMKTYGSPTLSDQALMPFPSVKIGPGDSARSHTADEFIYIKELEEAIPLYIKLISNLELKK